MADLGTCEHCSQQFAYALIHSGFAESAYAYCDPCGRTAILSAWTTPPEGAFVKFDQAIGPDVEPFLESCLCGGRFRAGAAPRCPRCNESLSADLAAAYIESNAPGAPNGWRWQRSWTGLHCIIVEQRVRRDPWRFL